jgi:hypothetical protein
MDSEQPLPENKAVPDAWIRKIDDVRVTMSTMDKLPPRYIGWGALVDELVGANKLRLKGVRGEARRVIIPAKPSRIFVAQADLYRLEESGNASVIDAARMILFLYAAHRQKNRNLFLPIYGVLMARNEAALGTLLAEGLHTAQVALQACEDALARSGVPGLLAKMLITRRDAPENDHIIHDIICVMWTGPDMIRADHGGEFPDPPTATILMQMRPDLCNARNMHHVVGYPVGDESLAVCCEMYNSIVFAVSDEMTREFLWMHKTSAHRMVFPGGVVEPDID